METIKFRQYLVYEEQIAKEILSDFPAQKNLTKSQVEQVVYIAINNFINCLKRHDFIDINIDYQQ